MNKLSPTAALLIEKLLGKVTEKSSVISYLTIILAVFGIKDGNVAVQIAGGLASIAGLVLFILNDQTLSRLIISTPVTGDVVEPNAITIPAPLAPTLAAPAAPIEEIPMSWLTALATLLANVNPIAQAAVEAVTVVEAIAPNAPGVQKLASAQAYVTQKLGSVESTAEEVTSTINSVVAALNAPTMPFAQAKSDATAAATPAK
jgi:hypothetical protein